MQKDLSKEEWEFAETFTALAYFRVPQFRVKLLENIILPDDPEMNEKRGTEFILKNQHEADMMVQTNID